MKRRILILVSLVVFVVACGKLGAGGGGGGGGKPQIPGEGPPYAGKWLSDCMNLTGGGTINRIYMEIASDQKVSVALLVYAGASCTGGYNLTDGNGNPVTEPQLVQQMSAEIVENIPENFYVIKTTSLSTMNVAYSVMFLNDSEFYQLSVFNNPHETWNQWQGEADVSQFAANPTTYNPLVYDKYHFVRSELP